MEKKILNKKKKMYLINEPNHPSCKYLVNNKRKTLTLNRDKCKKAESINLLTNFRLIDVDPNPNSTTVVNVAEKIN